MLDEIKERLCDEIEGLSHELRVTLPHAIQKAVELGDLRENGDYRSALERQQFVQARLGHLTQRLAEISRIDVDTVPADRVGFGSKVRLRNTRTGESSNHTLVAGDFIDLDAGHVSMASPLGRALLGRSVGESFTVSLPGGENEYDIIELTTLHQQI